MGTIVRDSIVPYTTARKAGWNDVIFLGAASSYDSFVGAAQGMDGFYAMGLTEMPYVDSPVPTVKKFRLIEQQLTPEDDEVTPTMKLKRKFVSEKYKGMIDGMYAEAS